MEDGWESHVSPLMMGVGMGDMQGIAEMQPQGQDIPGELNMPQHHHQELHHSAPHPDLNADMHPDIEQDLRHEMRSHQDSMGTSGAGDYFSHHHQV